MILYFTDISLNNLNGKEKATNEKIEAMNKSGQFKIIQKKEIQKNLIGKFINDLHITNKILKSNEKIVLYRSSFSILPLIIAKLKSKKLIEELHADVLEENNLLRSGIKKYIYKYFLLIRKLLNPKVDGYIINHPFLKKLTYDKKHLVSYNGVSINNKHLEIRNYRKDKKLCKNILFIGSGSVWHGLDKLIETWKCIEDEINWNLIIVGKAKSVKSKKIIFKGQKYGDELIDIIKKSDAFILPVHNIRISPGSPLKLYEYLAYGKPILTESIVGYSDEVIKYNCGIHTNLFKPQSLKKSLIDLEEKFLNNNWKPSSLEILENEISWRIRIDKWGKWILENF